VRARAAIAIGALGDQRGIDALESALLDEHSSVRIQAINALGQLGGERASIALGNVLIESGRATMERVLAAQALWRHESVIARSYLDIGATDPNKQVRKASSQPQPAVKVRQSGKYTGSSATE
jgi:HEAT repeat protein